MIEINLLPEYLRTFPEKEKEKAVSQAIFKKNIMLFMAGVGGILLAVYLLIVMIPMGYYLKKASDLDFEWNKMKDYYEKIAVVLNKEKRFSSKEAALNGQKTERQIWSMILNTISDAVPWNVQLTSVRDENIQEFIIEKVQVIEGGKKVEREQRGVKVSKMLNITGNYRVVKKGEDPIEAFLGSLKGSKVFAELFEKIELLSFASIEGGRKSFSIKCWFK